ncbi:Insect cuticle protein [Trinorchestia longiramus]|nr:Insect cuticle protein [Trinorchestia longiramus]
MHERDRQQEKGSVTITTEKVNAHKANASVKAFQTRARAQHYLTKSRDLQGKETKNRSTAQSSGHTRCAAVIGAVLRGCALFWRSHAQTHTSPGTYTLYVAAIAKQQAEVYSWSRECCTITKAKKVNCTSTADAQPQSAELTGDSASGSYDPEVVYSLVASAVRSHRRLRDRGRPKFSEQNSSFELETHKPVTFERNRNEDVIKNGAIINMTVHDHTGNNGERNSTGDNGQNQLARSSNEALRLKSSTALRNASESKNIRTRNLTGRWKPHRKAHNIQLTSTQSSENAENLQNILSKYDLTPVSSLITSEPNETVTDEIGDEFLRVNLKNQINSSAPTEENSATQHDTHNLEASEGIIDGSHDIPPIPLVKEHPLGNLRNLQRFSISQVNEDAILPTALEREHLLENQITLKNNRNTNSNSSEDDPLKPTLINILPVTAPNVNNSEKNNDRNAAGILKHRRKFEKLSKPYNKDASTQEENLASIRTQSPRTRDGEADEATERSYLEQRKKSDENNTSSETREAEEFRGSQSQVRRSKRRHRKRLREDMRKIIQQKRLRLRTRQQQRVRKRTRNEQLPSDSTIGKTYQGRLRIPEEGNGNRETQISIEEVEGKFDAQPEEHSTPTESSKKALHPVIKKVEQNFDNITKSSLKKKRKEMEDARKETEASSDYDFYDDLHDPAPVRARYPTRHSKIRVTTTPEAEGASQPREDFKDDGKLKDVDQNQELDEPTPERQMPPIQPTKKTRETSTHISDDKSQSNGDFIIEGISKEINGNANSNSGKALLSAYPHRSDVSRRTPVPQILKPTFGNLPFVPVLPVSLHSSMTRGIVGSNNRSPLVPIPVPILPPPPIYRSTPRPTLPHTSSFHTNELIHQQRFRTNGLHRPVNVNHHSGGLVSPGSPHPVAVTHSQNLVHRNPLPPKKFLPAPPRSPQAIGTVTSTGSPLSHFQPDDDGYNDEDQHEQDDFYEAGVDYEESIGLSQEEYGDYPDHYFSHEDYQDEYDNDIQYQTREQPLQYGYKVASADTGNYQQRNEQRDGKEVTGSYKVALPDGRIQTVTYIADAEGFRAEVTYENNPTFETSTAHPAVATTTLPPRAPFSSSSPSPLSRPNGSSNSHGPILRHQPKDHDVRNPNLQSNLSPLKALPALHASLNKIPPHPRQTLMFPSTRQPSQAVAFQNVHSSPRPNIDLHRQTLKHRPLGERFLPGVNSNFQSTLGTLNPTVQENLAGISRLPDNLQGIPDHANTNFITNHHSQHQIFKPPTRAPNQFPTIQPTFPRTPHAGHIDNDDPNVIPTVTSHDGLVNSIQTSERPRPTPFPISTERPPPIFLQSRFNDKPRNKKHKPVKPAPVKISIHHSNDIPFYPGINFPTGKRSNTFPSLRPGTTFDLRDPGNHRELRKPTEVTKLLPTSHLNLQELRIPKKQRHRTPSVKKVSNSTRFKQSQIDFKEHVAVTTPSPNPFRVTLSGSQDRVPSRTTSRGRIIPIRHSVPTRISQSGRNQLMVGFNVGPTRSALAPGKSEKPEHHSLEETSATNEHASEEVKQALSHGQSIPTTTQTSVTHVKIRSSTPSTELIQTPSEISQISNTTPIPPVNYSPVLRSPTIFQDSSRPAKPLFGENDRVQQQNTAVHRTRQNTQGIKRKRRPLRINSNFAKEVESKSNPPERYSLNSPEVSDELTSKLELYHYELKPESSKESTEKKTLYNPNAKIVLKALGKSRQVPLLLPYGDEGEFLRASHKNSRPHRKHATKGTNSSAKERKPFSSLKPVPVVSIAQR